MSASSEIRVHMGQTLVRLANTYPSLLLTLIEGAQNAIDAGANRIMLCVDLQKRSVVVADNGAGVSPATFEEALSSVGKGIKSKDKLGRFGLGLISPLTKCEKFTFVSATAGSHRANLWTFAVKDIRDQHQDVNIPRDEIASLPKLTAKFQSYAADEFACEWHTMVIMSRVTQDKVISIVDLDELESQVQDKLGEGMWRSKVMIRVVLIDDRGRVQSRDIEPVHFSGEPLPIVEYDDEDAGRVQFELFRAPKRHNGRNGKVSVMANGDNYRITMSEFIRQARGRKAADLLGEAMKALSSGYFEGVIRCQNIVLAPERTKFEYTAALESLYLIVDQWYEEHGKFQLKNEQEQSRETRWQDVALKSADRLRSQLERPDFARIWDKVMSTVEFGRLGLGHIDPSKGKPEGTESERTLRTGQGGVGKPKNPRDSDVSSASTGLREPKDRPGDTPIGARGPQGRHRRLVKGDSKGLWFGFEEMPLRSVLWDFDRQLGVLVINTRHPTWVRLDETNGKHLARNAKWTQQLLEWLALEVLVLLDRFPDESDFEHNRSLLDTKVVLYARMFIAPEAF